MSGYEQREGLFNKVWSDTYWGNLLFSCDLEVTARCNERCAFCYRDSLPQGADRISPEKILSLLDELRSLGVLTLHITGGEPFLRNDIREILSRAKKNGFEVSLTTNGTAQLAHELAGFMADNYIGVKVSLHAPTAEVHDRITGAPGSFDKAVKFIKRLVDLRAKVSINMVLCRLNIGTLEDMIAFSSRLGVAGLAPTLQLLGKIEKAAENDGLRVGFDEAVNAAFMLKKAGMAPAPKKTRFLVCNSGKNMATIDPDGNVFPCNTLREPCGNILSAPLADIWKTGPGFQSVRALAEKDLINCATCENEPFCIRCLGEIKARTGGYIENTCVVCDLAKVWKRADVLWRQNGNG